MAPLGLGAAPGQSVDTLLLTLPWLKFLPPQESVGQGDQYRKLTVIFGQSPQPGFLESKLLLEHPEAVLHHPGSTMGLGLLDPWCTVPPPSSGQRWRSPGPTAMGQSITLVLPSAPASEGLGSPHSHGPPPLHAIACCHPLITLITDVSRGDGHGVDQAGVLV